mgnify:CR=1 FL=1
MRPIRKRKDAGSFSRFDGFRWAAGLRPFQPSRSGGTGGKFSRRSGPFPAKGPRAGRMPKDPMEGIFHKGSRLHDSLYRKAGFPVPTGYSARGGNVRGRPFSLICFPSSIDRIWRRFAPAPACWTGRAISSGRFPSADGCPPFSFAKSVRSWPNFCS